MLEETYDVLDKHNDIITQCEEIQKLNKVRLLPLAQNIPSFWKGSSGDLLFESVNILSDNINQKCDNIIKFVESSKDKAKREV